MVSKLGRSYSLPRPTLRWGMVAIAIGVALAGGLAIVTSRISKLDSPSVDVVAIPKITTVTALGRLEPFGETIRLSASGSADGNRIAQLLVQEGEQVEAGQTIAILDNHQRLQAALSEALAKVAIAEANLAVVQAGAKAGEIEAQRAAIARYEAELLNNTLAQQATVARLEAELRTAEADEGRFRQLYEEGAISASEWDSQRLRAEEARRQLEEGEATLARIQSSQQQQLKEAIATLDRIAEVRPVDVTVASAEVQAARAAVEYAEAELELASIRAPQAGQVLKIHTRPGEVISSNGVVEMGQTQQMVAVAEIYESDIRKVQVGQPATVTSSALPGVQLSGQVQHIDLQVQRQTVINEDPAANIDAKTVEVKVLLDEPSSAEVAGLTNLRVTVTVETES